MEVNRNRGWGVSSGIPLPGAGKTPPYREAPTAALPCGPANCVDGLVGLLVAQDGLDVLAGLGEGNGFHKLVHAVVGAGGLPFEDAVVAGVVGRQRVLLDAAEFVQGLAQVARAQPDVGLRIKQLIRSRNG